MNSILDALQTRLTDVADAAGRLFGGLGDRRS